LLELVDRCLKGVRTSEKEDLVESYLSLSNSTLGYIYPAYDPDRQKAINKSIRYEWFIEFVQKFSERDALITKLIYFGGPSMEEVC